MAMFEDSAVGSVPRIEKALAGPDELSAFSRARELSMWTGSPFGLEHRPLQRRLHRERRGMLAEG